MFVRFSAIAAFFALTACVTTEEAEKSRLDEAQSACVSYGFEPGTEGFAQCVQSEVQAAEEKRRRAGAAIAGAFAQYGQNMRDTYRQPTRTNCTRGYGGSVNCTTY